MDLRPPDQVIAAVCISIPITVLENATGHALGLVAYVAQWVLIFVLLFGYFGLLEAIQSTHVCLHELLEEEPQPEGSEES